MTDDATDRARLLEQAVEAAPMLIFVADESMRYIAVSDYACDVLGYTSDELLGMRVTDVAIEPRAGGDYQRMVEAGWLVGVSRLRCKDGSEVVLRYRAGETEVDGQPAYVSVGWLE
jgi:PAS domain S-box-containing protein